MVVSNLRLSATPEGQRGSSTRVVDSWVDSVVLTQVVTPESNVHSEPGGAGAGGFAAADAGRPRGDVDYSPVAISAAIWRSLSSGARSRTQSRTRATTGFPVIIIHSFRRPRFSISNVLALRRST